VRRESIDIEALLVSVKEFLRGARAGYRLRAQQAVGATSGELTILSVQAPSRRRTRLDAKLLALLEQGTGGESIPP